MFTSSPYVLCSCELWGCASVFLSHTFISEKGFLRSVTKTAASEHGRVLSCVVPTNKWRSAPFNGALHGWAACARQTHAQRGAGWPCTWLCVPLADEGLISATGKLGVYS